MNPFKGRHFQRDIILWAVRWYCKYGIKYRNNVIECDHGKLKRIINATLGFKSMKTAYATIKGIEVMRALRKGQASAFYYGDPLGEMRLVSRVFEM